LGRAFSWPFASEFVGTPGQAFVVLLIKRGQQLRGNTEAFRTGNHKGSSGYVLSDVLKEVSLLGGLHKFIVEVGNDRGVPPSADLGEIDGVGAH
jgi:hypothetical protein